MANEQYSVSVVLSAVDQSLTSTLSKAESQVRNFENSLRAIPQNVAQVGSSISSMGNSIASMGQSISKVGLGMTALTLPIMKFGKVSLDSFREFDEGLIKVGKTSDITGADLQNLGDQFLVLSKKVATPVEEVLEYGEIAGQLFDTTGNSAQENGKKILEFSETMSKLAKTTNVVGQEGAKSMMNFLNVMKNGLPGITDGSKQAIDYSEQLGSALVHLGNNANTNEAKILAMAERMGLTAEMAGFTAPQVLGLATTFSEFGIEAQRGSSGFRMFTSSIEKGVAKGGAQLQLYAKLSKMSASEFAEAWRTEPMDALQHLLIGFKDAVEHGESASVLLSEMDMKGQFSQETFKALASSIQEAGGTNEEFLGSLIDNLVRAEEGWNEVTYATDRYGNYVRDANGELVVLKENTNFMDSEFSQAMNAINAKWQQFKSAIEQVTNTIGVMLKPAISGLLHDATEVVQGIWDKVSAFYQEWKGWDEGAQEQWGQHALKIAGLVLSAGPLLTIGGKLIQGSGLLIKSFGDGITTVAQFGDGLVQSAQKGIEAFTGFEPVNDLIYETHFKLLEFAEMITNKFPVAGQIFQGFSMTMKVGSALAGAALKTIAPAALIGAILATIGLLPEGAREHLINFANTAKEKGPEFITNLTTGIAQKIPELVSKGTEVVTAFMEAIAANLPAIITGGAEIIASLVNGVAQNASQLIESAIHVIGQFLLGIVQALPTLLSAGLNMLVALAQGIADNMPLIITTAGHIVLELLKGIITSLPQLIVAGAQIVASLVNGLNNAIGTLAEKGWEMIKTLIGGMIQGIAGMFGKLGNSILEFLHLETAYASEEAGPAAKQAGEHVGDSLNEGVETGVAKTEETFGRLPGAITSSLEATTGAVDATSANWESLLSNNANSAVESTSSALGQLTPRAQTLMDSTTSVVDSSTQNLASTVENNTAGMADGMATNFQSGLDSILSSSQNVSTIVPSDASTMNEQTVAQYQTMSKNIQNAMLDAEMFVRIGSERIGQSFIEMSSEIPKTFENLGTQMDGAMSTVFTNIQTNIQTSLLNIQTTAQSQMNAMMTVLSQGFNKLPTIVQASMVKVATTVQTNFNKMVNITNSSMSKMASVSSSNLSKLQSVFNSHFNNINQTVNKNLTAVDNTVKSKMNSIDNTVKSKNQNIHNIFNQTFNKIEQLVKTKLNTIDNQYKTTFNHLNSTTTSGFNQMKNSFTQSLNGMLRAFQSFSSSLMGQARNTVNNLINTMRSAYGGMYNAGAYAGQGFRNGLASQSGGIMATARSIANSVTNTIRSALRIHSPSRETKKLGEYTGQGMQIGLEGSLKDIETSSSKVAFKSMSAISQVMPPFLKMTKTFTDGIKTLVKDAENQVIKSTNNIVSAMEKASNANVSVKSSSKSSSRSTSSDKKSSKSAKRAERDAEKLQKEKEKAIEEAEKKEKERIEKIKREAEKVKREAVSAINQVNTSLETIHKLQDETLKLDRKHTDNIMGTASAYNKSLKKLKTMTTKADLIPETPIAEVQAEIEQLNFEGVEQRFIKMNDYLLKVWDKNKDILEADDETAIALAEGKVDEATQDLINSLKSVDNQSVTTTKSVATAISTVADSTVKSSQMTKDLGDGLTLTNSSIETTGKLINSVSSKSIQDVNNFKKAILQATIDINKFLVPILNDYSKLFSKITKQASYEYSKMSLSIVQDTNSLKTIITNQIDLAYNHFLSKMKEAKSEFKTLSTKIDNGGDISIKNVKTNTKAVQQPNNYIPYENSNIDANIILKLGNNEYVAYVKDIRDETERQEMLERRF